VARLGPVCLGFVLYNSESSLVVGEKLALPFEVATSMIWIISVDRFLVDRSASFRKG